MDSGGLSSYKYPLFASMDDLLCLLSSGICVGLSLMIFFISFLISNFKLAEYYAADIKFLNRLGRSDDEGERILRAN